MLDGDKRRRSGRHKRVSTWIGTGQTDRPVSFWPVRKYGGPRTRRTRFGHWLQCNSKYFEHCRDQWDNLHDLLYTTTCYIHPTSSFCTTSTKCNRSLPIPYTPAAMSGIERTPYTWAPNTLLPPEIAAPLRAAVAILL